MTSSINKSANPQGKGLVALLDSLQQAKQQLVVPAKNLQQISSDLFTSLFVLNSQIRFKPTAGQTYWLYFKDNQYRLSLIAPEQWPPAQSGRFIGACELQADLSWTLELADDCVNDNAFLQEIADRRQQLQQAETIDAALPVYLETLPYPRLGTGLFAETIDAKIRNFRLELSAGGKVARRAKRITNNPGYVILNEAI
ncbi:DUF2452 domain-containing protein [Methylomonas sp. HW2-6]|uniref:DUF2452 domain-containing protein n=1 Tax=Methylomonas sp. HW2-6 TaxID=3376687 RepID=UPI004041D66B